MKYIKKSKKEIQVIYTFCKEEVSPEEHKRRRTELACLLLDWHKTPEISVEKKFKR